MHFVEWPYLMGTSSLGKSNTVRLGSFGLVVTKQFDFRERFPELTAHFMDVDRFVYALSFKSIGRGISGSFFLICDSRLLLDNTPRPGISGMASPSPILQVV